MLAKNLYPFLILLSFVTLPGCMKNYYVRWFGEIPAESICGDSKKCIAGGGNLAFTSFDKRNSNPPPYEGDPMSYLGRMFNVRDFSDNWKCIEKSKLASFVANTVRVKANISKEAKSNFEFGIKADVAKYLVELIKKSGVQSIDIKAKVDAVISKTNSYFRSVDGNILYQEYALKQESLDLIKGDSACQNLALVAQRDNHKKLAIMSNIVVIAVDADWSSRLADTIIGNLKIEFGVDAEKIIDAGGSIGGGGERDIKQNLTGIAETTFQIFSVAYTPMHS